MSEKIEPVYSEEVDFDIEVSNHSDLVYRIINPQNSSSATVTSGSSYGPTTLLTAPQVHNMKYGSIQGQIQISAQTTGQYNYINANLLTIFQRIKVYDTFNNAIWMDVNNLGNAMAVLAPICTPLEKFLTKSLCNTFTPSFLGSRVICPATTASDSSYYVVEDIARFNQQPVFTATTYSAATTATTSPLATYSPPNNYVGVFTTAATYADLFVQNSFTSIRQFYISASSATVSYLDFSIPHSAFKFTVLNTDKLLWTPTNIMMEIWWNSTDNWAFSGSDPANPQTGCLSLTTTTTIANITQTIACENNQRTIDLVVEKVQKYGLSIEIPWMTTWRQAISSSTNHSYQIALSSAYGNSLLLMVTAPFQSVTSATLAYLANIHERGYLSNYNTYINNISIAFPNNYDVTQCQDYYIGNRKFLAGSAVQTLGEYVLANWCHVDSWMGTKPLHVLVDEADQATGKDLHTVNSVWQWRSTYSTAMALTWQTLLIGQKLLQISSRGSIVA